MCLFKAFGWQTVSLPVSWHLLPKCLYVLNLFCTCYDMKLQPPPWAPGAPRKLYWYTSWDVLVRGNPIYSGPLFRFTPAPFSVYSGPLFGLLRPPFWFTPDTFFSQSPAKTHPRKVYSGKIRVYSGAFSGLLRAFLRDIFGFTPGHFRVYSGTFSGLLRDIFGFTPGHFRILPQKLPQSWVLANCWVVDGLLLKVEWCCLTSLAGWLADFL